MGRPKLYENAAARQAAYRENNSRLDVVIPLDMSQTLDEIADTLGLTKNALVNAMLRFSLTNHNWKKGGVWLPKK